MACIPCQRHRKAVADAVKSGDVKRVASTTTKAAVALGQNTAAKVLARFGKK